MRTKRCLTGFYFFYKKKKKTLRKYIYISMLLHFFRKTFEFHWRNFCVWMQNFCTKLARLLNAKSINNPPPKKIAFSCKSIAILQETLCLLANYLLFIAQPLKNNYFSDLISFSLQIFREQCKVSWRNIIFFFPSHLIVSFISASP